MLRIPIIAIIFFFGLGCNRSTPVPGQPAVAAEAKDPAESPTPAGERIENPHYLQWAAHKPGTTIVVKEKTETPGYSTETISTFKLKSVDDKRVVVEAASQIVSPDGTKYPVETQEQSHSRWVYASSERAKKDLTRPIGTVEERDERITVLGREYQTKWYKAKGHVEAGDTFTESWIVNELPGGLARSIHTIPAAKKTISTELIEVKAP